MSVTSDALKKPNKFVSDAANDIVKSYLKAVDNAINLAPKIIGKNFAFIELPTSFPLEGLEKSSGQALIYSLIIKHLKEEQKLEPKLVLKPDKTILVVQFNVGPDQVEFSIIKQFVKDHVITDQQLKQILKK